MTRYFKVVEIEADEYIEATHGDLDCCQEVVPVDGTVFVAVDDDAEYDISVPLESFDE